MSYEPGLTENALLAFVQGNNDRQHVPDLNRLKYPGRFPFKRCLKPFNAAQLMR